MNAVARYFDLYSEKRIFKSEDAGPPRYAAVLPQYLALVLGIVAEMVLTVYAQTGGIALDLGAIWLRLLISTIIAIVLLPGVYKNSFDPDKPIIVQLAAIFAAGVGWQSVINALAG